MPHDTDGIIAALSTPPGASGIAVVRISGDGALDVLARVFARPRQGEWEHRRLYRGILRDGDEAVDDVMCAVMRAPDTYTGEDTVEISCHGGPAVVSRVLGLLYSTGARPAGPGEFTRRAFLNGKMDLIQAEAVADLIHARSELQRQVAHRQLGGGLSRRIDALAEEMMSVLGVVEANIDFIEADIDTIDVPATIAILESQQREIRALLESAALSRPLREGYSVVLAGPVNAGKSSLFNRLVGEGRAIVTDVPGTTRDVLRETVVLDGVAFVLQDTAGLRDPGPDPIEMIGMQRSGDAIADSDVVLLVLDATLPPPNEMAVSVAGVDPDRLIVVANKMDLREHADVANIAAQWPGCIGVSARTGAGVDELRDALLSAAGAEALTRIARERGVLNSRLAALLRQAYDRLDVLGEGLRRKDNLEILALEARAVVAAYEEATGRAYHDGLLDVIFTRFCIGK